MKKYSMFLVGIITLCSFAFPLPIGDEQFDELSIYAMLKENTLYLECDDGCNWTKLSFTLGAEDVVWVDNHGMVDPANSGEESAFLISFQRDGAEVACKSDKLTAWKDLTFRCGSSVYCWSHIDEQGVTVGVDRN